MKNISKFIFFLLIIIIFIFIIISFFILNSYIEKNYQKINFIINQNTYSNNISNNDSSDLIADNNVPFEKVVFENHSISISIIGDIMCHNTQIRDAYRNNTYDFSYVFSDIKNYIESADISIGNLETTFAGNSIKYDGYPNFNTPENLAYNLKDLGLDILSTANNHSLDTGYSGLESTINFLNNAQISHTGTFRSSEEQHNILYKEVNHIKIAFLAFTYGTNGIPIPTEKDYCINVIDKNFIKSQIELAKQQNPDIICVNMHWGEEYKLSQIESQMDLTNFLFENGVDIILGSHPHVLEPMEKRTITLPDGTEKDVFVIYSLGNFMSGQTQKNTRSSIILNLKLTKHEDNNKISIDEISYVPIYTYTNPNYKNYKILDIEKTIYNYENNINNTISNDDYLLLKNELQNIHGILNK